MAVASALVTAAQAAPGLAESAVREALQRAGLPRAEGLILFLSEEFGRHHREAVVAAARAAGCLSIFGGVCQGLFNEEEWVLDRPAAAALVLSTPLLGNPPAEVPRILLGGGATLPAGTNDIPPRAGLLNGQLPLWAGGSPTPDRVEFSPAGYTAHIACATGLLPLGKPQTIHPGPGLEVERIGHTPAAEHLRRQLPPELRGRNPLPLHALAALREGDPTPITLLAIHPEGSVTLAEALPPGTALQWAVRQPLPAEQEQRQQLAALSHLNPAFALMFSCIGRGPLFYGSDDRDLAVFRETFPATPLLGAYGTAQIAPVGSINCLLHNSAVTALFTPHKETHVQSQP